MTPNETAQLFAKLKATWPEQTMTLPRCEVYHEALADLPWIAVDEALKWHIAEEKWFPKPAELRSKAITLLDGVVRYDSYAGLGGGGAQKRVRLAIDYYGQLRALAAKGA